LGRERLGSPDHNGGVTNDEAIAIIRERVGKAFMIKEIILFGSRARGDEQEDSDFDVLLIVESEVPFAERQSAALQALGRRDFSVDLLVFTQSEVERAAAMTGSAVYWALREGKRYAA